MKIDTHQHFWNFREQDYPWMMGGMEIQVIVLSSKVISTQTGSYLQSSIDEKLIMDLQGKQRW